MENVKELRERLVGRVRRYRSQERLSFKDIVESEGMDTKAFDHLKNIIRSYQDEHDAKRTSDHARFQRLVHYYLS